MKRTTVLAKLIRIGALAGVVGLPAHAHAQVRQAASIAAPVTAVAVGPARARVEIGAISSVPGAASTSVHVGAPVTAIAPPFTSVVIRIQ